MTDAEELIEALQVYNPTKNGKYKLYIQLSKNKRLDIQVTDVGISTMVFEKTEYGYFGVGKSRSGSADEMVAHIGAVVDGWKFLYG